MATEVAQWVLDEFKLIVGNAGFACGVAVSQPVLVVGGAVVALAV